MIFKFPIMGVFMRQHADEAAGAFAGMYWALMTAGAPLRAGGLRLGGRGLRNVVTPALEPA